MQGSFSGDIFNMRKFKNLSSKGYRVAETALPVFNREDIVRNVTVLSVKVQVSSLFVQVKRDR